MNKKEKLDQSSLQKDKKVKRVKTHHTRSSAIHVPLVKVDCFHLEEEESTKQNAEDGFNSFKESCGQLRKTFETIYAAKKNKKLEGEVRSRVTDACMLVMGMKKLNRLDKHRWKRSRDAVTERKMKVDNLNLQYQNLLYEVTHLQKEVTKCLEFRSRDEEIELVSVEEFYKNAPVGISRPSITKADTHELTMARLQWELEQRKRLAVKLKESEIIKEECKANIRKLRECLGNIQPTLNCILEASEPLQSKLGMPLQATQLKHKIARFLSKPLYVLYIEASAYKEACDKNIAVSVEGNVDEARVLQLKTGDVLEDSGESDQEENSTAKKRHRHSLSVRSDGGDKEILAKHPLSVCLAVCGQGSKICIEFFYLVNLNIVTASVKTLTPSSPLSTSISLLEPNTFLSCLFPDDNGKESPNPANKYHLQRINYTETPFTNVTGWPYIWVQQIAGLKFINLSDLSNSESSQSSHINPPFMETAVSAIRLRLLARVSLSNQMSSFEHGARVPSTLTNLYPPNVSSQLKKWTGLSVKEIEGRDNIRELRDLHLLNPDSFIYKATVERGSATLTAYVIIAPDYPTKNPLFLLNLLWKGESTSFTNNALRELEEEVNIHCIHSLPENCWDYLLVYQMHHLLACFDIFLETEPSTESIEGPKEFSREKVVTRTYRGRSHTRPYKYLAAKGIFTQR